MQKVDVQLFNEFPEILSSVNGDIKFVFNNKQPNTSGKLYTFYSNDTINIECEPGSVVICQVKNTMAVGVVRAVSDDVTEEEFLEATIERSEKVKNGYRLILAVVDVETLSVQMRFKHLYEKKKLEEEAKPKINQKAFRYAIDNL